MVSAQVDVLSTFFAVVDKSLKGRFRTGQVQALLEDRRGADGVVSQEEWEAVCNELRERYGVDPMMVWADEAAAGSTGEGEDLMRRSGGSDGSSGSAAATAAMCRYYYRDPGGNPLDVLSGNARGGIVAATVHGLAEDDPLTVSN